MNIEEVKTDVIKISTLSQDMPLCFPTELWQTDQKLAIEGSHEPYDIRVNTTTNMWIVSTFPKPPLLEKKGAVVPTHIKMRETREIMIFTKEKATYLTLLPCGVIFENKRTMEPFLECFSGYCKMYNDNLKSPCRFLEYYYD